MRLLLCFVVLVVLAITAGGGGAFYLWKVLNTPVIHDRKQSNVIIDRGASTEEILAKLKENGIIKDDFPLRFYLRIKRGQSVMKAGSYIFPTPISPMEVLDMLQKGGSAHEKLTVIEGWTRFDVARALKSVAQFNLTSEADALALLDDTSAIADLDPSATNLEGYLFPDTYFVETDTTAKSLVSQMVKRFRSVYADQLAKDLPATGLPLHSIVTVASIIETEAKLSNERPVVASVVYNRIRLGMRLSMDSTIVYASKMAGKWRDDGKVYQSDLDRDSPYNTRKYKGLPPGPVGNPGLSSLFAAAHPASTNYLYYVRNPARNDGAHNYYSSAAEFDKGVLALRNWEKNQRKKGLR